MHQKKQWFEFLERWVSDQKEFKKYQSYQYSKTSTVYSKKDRKKKEYGKKNSKSVFKKWIQKVCSKSAFKKCIQRVYLKNVFKKCIQKMYSKNVFKKCIQKVLNDFSCRLRHSASLRHFHICALLHQKN
jgi:hypothetical protein